MITAIIVALLGAPIACATSQCPANRAFETFACAAGVCTSDTPTASTFTAAGSQFVATDSIVGWVLTVCAIDGQSLNGGGIMEVWGWNPWTPTRVWRNMVLDLALASVASPTSCRGAPCQCVSWSDQTTVVSLPRRFKLVPNGVTASGGAYIEVYLAARTKI